MHTVPWVWKLIVRHSNSILNTSIIGYKVTRWNTTSTAHRAASQLTVMRKQAHEQRHEAPAHGAHNLLELAIVEVQAHVAAVSSAEAAPGKVNKYSYCTSILQCEWDSFSGLRITFLKNMHIRSQPNWVKLQYVDELEAQMFANMNIFHVEDSQHARVCRCRGRGVCGRCVVKIKIKNDGAKYFDVLETLQFVKCRQQSSFKIHYFFRSHMQTRRDFLWAFIGRRTFGISGTICADFNYETDISP